VGEVVVGEVEQWGLISTAPAESFLQSCLSLARM
jgi:hypothetical protein